MNNAVSEVEVSNILRRHGIAPTSQRMSVAQVLFSECAHRSAEEIFKLVNLRGRPVSKATIYNTLGLLVAKGAVREVIVDASKVFYDPNTEPHHHFYDVKTGELRDIDANQIKISGFPELPEGKVLDGVEIVIRLR